MDSYHDTAGCYDLIDSGLERVLFLDYDAFPMQYEMLKAQLKTLQKRFKLSDFIILQTDTSSFHAICYDLLTSLEVEKIIGLTSCDTAFLENWKTDYSARVLRITQKGSKEAPKLVEILKSPYNKRKKSLGHIKFYESLLNINISNKKNAIETGLWGIKYQTQKV